MNWREVRKILYMTHDEQYEEGWERAKMLLSNSLMEPWEVLELAISDRDPHDLGLQDYLFFHHGLHREDYVPLQDRKANLNINWFWIWLLILAFLATGLIGTN